MPTTFTDIFGSLWIAVPAAIMVIMGFITLNALMIVWMERKVSARMQRRMGPTERGPAGLLQTLCDTIKLLGKELITPTHVSRKIFLAAPVILFAPLVAILSLFPVSPDWVFHDYEIALVVLLAFSGTAIIGIFAAGWGSNNKYSLLGAVRSISQNIAYEVPLVLSVIPIVLMAGSLNFREIVNAQSAVPFLVFQPLAAVLFLIAATAETNRAPFDIPEAESELIGGFHTEYSGMRFGMFFLAEYTNMVIVCALGAILFLGGWKGPFLPGPVWFFIKVYALIFIMMWFRWTFPRLRFDQLLRLAWLLLVPLGVLNLLVTAIVLKIL